LAHWFTPFKSFDVPYERTDPLKLSDRLHGKRTSGRPPYMPFVAVIIKSRLKKRLLKILEGTYNRTSRVLFPDYDGYRAQYYAQK
jgi:hypothetical protein